MNRYLIIIVICSLCLNLFLISFKKESRQTTEIVQQDITKQAIDHSIIMQTIIKKDGTKVVTTTKKDVDTTTKEAVEERKQVKEIPPLRYSFGCGTIISTSNITKPSDTYFSAGIRTLGPIWVEGSYQFKSKELTAGIRVEF